MNLQVNQGRNEPRPVIKPVSTTQNAEINSCPQRNLYPLQALFFYDQYLSTILFLISTVLSFFKLYALGYPRGQFLL